MRSSTNTTETAKTLPSLAASIIDGATSAWIANGEPKPGSVGFSADEFNRFVETYREAHEVGMRQIVALEFLSWDSDTEEARVAIPFTPDAEPDGGSGYVGHLNVRSEEHAREIVRRFNAAT